MKKFSIAFLVVFSYSSSCFSIPGFSLSALLLWAFGEQNSSHLSQQPVESPAFSTITDATPLTSLERAMQGLAVGPDGKVVQDQQPEQSNSFDQTAEGSDGQCLQLFPDYTGQSLPIKIVEQLRDFVYFQRLNADVSAALEGIRKKSHSLIILMKNYYQNFSKDEDSESAVKHLQSIRTCTDVSNEAFVQNLKYVLYNFCNDFCTRFFVYHEELREQLQTLMSKDDDLPASMINDLHVMLSTLKNYLEKTTANGDYIV